MPDFFTITTTGANLATSGTSAGAVIPPAQSGEVPRYVRVSASAGAYFRIGAGVQTAVAGDMMIQPGDATVLVVPRGFDHMAALQVSAAGVVQVSPLEDC